MKPYYNGRKKISIPISAKEFVSSPILYIKKYLSECLKNNQSNTQEFKELYDFYKGKQGVQEKTRLDGSEENNNKITTNHIWRQVEFKKGFMVGNPIEYSIATSGLNTDDMTYIAKYLRDSLKASKDIDKYEEMYVGGISNQFIMPRTDNFDVMNEAPFELYNVEIGSAFVVYSSDITNKVLFNVVISENVDIKTNIKSKVYDIYYLKEDGYCYTITIVGTNIINYTIRGNVEEKQSYKFLPIVEYSLNKNRMGIVELVFAIQNGLNAIHSNQIDDIVEFVNAYLVFENQKVNDKFKEILKEFKKQRVLSIYTSNPQAPAKVSLLKQSLDHVSINSFYELLKSEMYDIVACPLSSGNVTSGGDTGSARLLGNGWESSQNQAQTDTGYIQQFEYELFKKMLYICKDTYGTPIKEISASDIEIKYSINMSNNLQVKAQSLKYLFDMNMPLEESLIITGITRDTHGLAKKWQERIDYDEQQQLDKELKLKDNTNDNKTINE